MRRAEQTKPTICRVKAEMDKTDASGILPNGVRLERVYDRSELIGLTTENVLTNLAFGVLLIFAVQWLFLGSLRSAIVVAATIPFVLFSRSRSWFCLGSRRTCSRLARPHRRGDRHSR